MKIHVLSLAHVKGNVDNTTPLVVFTDAEKAHEWEQKQRAESVYKTKPEKDYFGHMHAYKLTYKEGSILQWFNPPGYSSGWQTYTEIDERDLESIVNENGLVLNPAD